MGIPRFFRWIGERYPCLSQVVKQYQIPDFDNLYLDVNGIIHTCSHPDDDNPHFRITEEKIFADICRYIEFLFTMIKPQKVFFIAVDGVAPRAKMNQQRGRRFKSAKMVTEQEAAARRRGEKLPETDRFDSNCITPGTEFMARLDNVLNHFIQYKVSTDPNWQTVTVYYSSHSVPGEGEHKIMDFLRYQRAQPTYNPETRHCLYGLDTDLIMLGLVTHEPYFSLLREEILFKRTAKRPTCPEQTTFYLLHLKLFREYLEFEFDDVKSMNLPFRFDMERVVDDWVLIEFLIGNDFIPHVPDCHVASNDLPELWKIYKEVLPTLGGYMNDKGRLNLGRFERFIQALAEFDRRKFESRYDDIKYMAGKTGGNFERNGNGRKEANGDDGFQLVSSNEKKLIKQLMPFYGDSEEDGEDGGLESMPDLPSEDDEEEEDLDEMDEEAIAFKAHKRDYYRSKMQLSGEKPMRTTEFVQLQVTAYIEAIEWTLRYYYEGVPSWSWFYPFHYAPYLSDMRNISELKLNFQSGHPFRPFEQLMSVLPSASRKLLPHAYRTLMTESTSSIKHFYPEDFATDLNGKQLDWESVVLIPFIEEQQLLAAIKPLERTLSRDEIDRNSFGTINAFRFQGDSHGTIIQSSLNFIPKYTNSATKECIPWSQYHLRPEEVSREFPLEALASLAYVPNFPTFKHIPCQCKMYAAGTSVFKMPSRNLNVIVKVPGSVIPSVDEIELNAKNQVGQIVLANWPFLTEARVVSIYTANKYFSVEGDDYSLANFKVNESNYTPDSDAFSLFEGDLRYIRKHFYSTRGLDFRETKCIVYAVTMTGVKYSENENGELIAVKMWSSTPQPYPFESIVFDLTKVATESSLLAAPPVHIMTSKLGELFPLGDTVFVVSDNYFGRKGIVVSYDENRNSVKVRIRLGKQPSFDDLISRLQRGTAGVVYNNASYIARFTKCSPSLIGKITGFIRVKKQSRPDDNGEVVKVNIGLDLKNSRDNLRMPGYSYRDDRGGWLYSDDVSTLIESYKTKFPQLFQRLQYLFDKNMFDPFNYTDLFPDAAPGSSEELAQVKDFLASLPTAKMTPVPNDSFILEEQLVREVDRCITKIGSAPNFTEVYLKPDALYRPVLSNRVNLSPEVFGNGNGANFNLLDRVVNIASSHSVPLGLEGTIIGVLEEANNASSSYEEKPVTGSPSKITYEVLFDQEFQHGATIRCPEKRAYRMFPQNLLGIRRAPRSSAKKVKNCVSRSAPKQQQVAAKQEAAPKNYAQAVSKEKPDPSSMWKAMESSNQVDSVGNLDGKSWPLIPANLIQEKKSETGKTNKGKKPQRQQSNSGAETAIPIPPRLFLGNPGEQKGLVRDSLTSILKDIGVPEVAAPTVATANKSANGRPAVPVFGSPSSAFASKKPSKQTPSTNTGGASVCEWVPKDIKPHDWDKILSEHNIKVRAISTAETAPSTDKTPKVQKPVQQHSKQQRIQSNVTSPMTNTAPAQASAPVSKVPLKERQSSVSGNQLMKFFNGTPVHSAGVDEVAASVTKTPSKHSVPLAQVDDAKIRMLQHDFAQLQAGKLVEFANIVDSASSSADSTPLQQSPSKQQNPKRLDVTKLITDIDQSGTSAQKPQRTDYVDKLAELASENGLKVRYEMQYVGKDQTTSKNRFIAKISYISQTGPNAPTPRPYEASFLSQDEVEARRSAAKSAFSLLNSLNWSKTVESPYRDGRTSPRKPVSTKQQFVPTQVIRNSAQTPAKSTGAAFSSPSAASVPMFGAAAPHPSALPIPMTNAAGFLPPAPTLSVAEPPLMSPVKQISPNSGSQPIDLNALLGASKPMNSVSQEAKSDSPPSATAKPKPRLAACFGGPPK